MAFVCTVMSGGVRNQGFEAGSGVPYFMVIDIGHDDTEPLNYSAVIGLDTLPGGEVELYFHIVEADGETGEERDFWSGRDTRFIARAVDRQCVLVAILVGLRNMLTAVEPEGFRWFTHDDPLPKRALVKFEAVRKQVERCGYRVASKRLPRGRRAWKATRLPADAIDFGGIDTDPIDVRR